MPACNKPDLIRSSTELNKACLQFWSYIFFVCVFMWFKYTPQIVHCADLRKNKEFSKSPSHTSTQKIFFIFTNISSSSWESTLTFGGKNSNIRKIFFPFNITIDNNEKKKFLKESNINHIFWKLKILQNRKRSEVTQCFAQIFAWLSLRIKNLGPSTTNNWYAWLPEWIC